MYETPHGFLHLDQPVAGVAVAAGPVRFCGWAVESGGVPLVDLRLRRGTTIYPISHGFPRVDLVAHFGLNQPFLPAGFEASLHLPAGTHEIAIDGLNLAGEWHALATIFVAVEGHAPPPPPPGRPVVESHVFARALRQVLRESARQPLRQTTRTVVGRLSLPITLRYPHHPFHGHIDQPALLHYVRFGQTFLDGWVFHETTPIRRLIATADLQSWQELQSAEPTPHIAALFPDFPTARHAGFRGLIDIPAQLPSPLHVRIYAELPDGSWHLCHIPQSHSWDQEQEKMPFVPFGPVRFAHAFLSLSRACRQRGFTVPWHRPLRLALRQVFQEYRFRAAPAQPPTIAPAAAPTTVAPDRLRRVVLFTHNLTREGAPLLLWEFARHLAGQGVQVTVVSPEPGPLARLYAELNAAVIVVDTTDLQSAATAADLAQAITRLAPAIPLADADLVVANTLPSYWGVHLAHRAGRPSLFCIHESTTPAAFYLDAMAPATLPLIESTFRLATHVAFPTDATRAYYRPWLARDNHGIHPSWIDVGMIDRYHASHPRVELRQALGLAATDQLVVNVGIVCDRKGQHLFVRSVDLLWRRAPTLAASCQFVMVGGRDTAFDRQLAATVAQLGRPNLRIIPATDQPLAYYGAADLAVCTSYEESFPRVIMEAMASHVPILSTGVHGINDMLTTGQSGWLVPPGDTHALAEGLRYMLSHSAEARTFAITARARVAADYDAAVLLPRQATLAARIAGALN